MARTPTNGSPKSRSVTVSATEAIDIALIAKVEEVAKRNRRSTSDQILMDLNDLKQYQQTDQPE